MDPVEQLAANIRDAAGLMVSAGETFEGPVIRHGQVTAVTLAAGGSVCSVLLSSGNTITGVRCLSPYVPIVNDAVVMVAYPGGRLIAIGCTNRSDDVPQSYTPTMGVWTLGNGTASGSFSRQGNICHFSAVFTFGTTTTFTASEPTFSLPIAPSAFTTESSIRSTILFTVTDNSGAGLIQGNGFGISGSTIRCAVADKSSGTYATTFGNLLSSTYPFVWTSVDAIRYGGWYWV